MSPASICLYPTDLHKIENVSPNVENPCVVVNFPFADDLKGKILREIEIATKYNAEIDFVFPTFDFLSKKNLRNEYVKDILSFFSECLKQFGNKANIKVIFETALFYKDVDRSSQLLDAIELVCEYLYSEEYTLFLKTSTGKLFDYEDHTKAISVMNIFLISKYKSGKENLGIKVSGGIRNMDDVNKYISLLNPELNLIERNKFRFGASKLLSNLI